MSGVLIGYPRPIGGRRRRVRRRRGGFINPLTIHSILQAVKPVSFIDGGLQALGIRDKVRGALNNNKFGKYLVQGADLAKSKLGYGRRRRGGKATLRKRIGPRPPTKKQRESLARMRRLREGCTDGHRVKGFTRKNGVVVKPHCRKSRSRKRQVSREY